MAGTTPGPNEAMLHAMEALWRLDSQASVDLSEEPAFERLCKVCLDSYPNITETCVSLALSTALRALGLPRNHRARTAHLASTAEEAAHQLDAAIRATRGQRLHIAPLDQAAEIPPHTFGAAQVDQFPPSELDALIDGTRLKRMFPESHIDSGRFSKFHWLVVREEIALDTDPGKRCFPGLFLDFSQDLGQIEPHKKRFPHAFEDALFVLLLAPWEAWSTMPEVDWRGFRVPWVYTANSDIFVRPSIPPSPDTLSWDLRWYEDGRGGFDEVEHPLALPLCDEVKAKLGACTREFWDIAERAKESVLFETPIAHFFLRAFLSEGVDEFLAHITTIEAALGSQADYKKGSQKKHKKMSATARVRGRVAGLLEDRCRAYNYEKLFDLRCTFIHGRSMGAISTKQRLMARSLAREVVQALLLATQTGKITSRDDFLDDLLDKGVSIIE